jgi:hypothetical protein
VPAKDATDAPAERSPPPKFRRASPELVRRMARRVVRGGRASFASQAAFRAALLDLVRREEPLAAIGGARMRRLLLDVPGVRMTVRYSERHDGRALDACPVCGSELRPIRNRTLTGGSVVLGHRCVRCEYWTHEARRVPVRYAFAKAGIDGRPAPSR